MRAVAVRPAHQVDIDHAQTLIDAVLAAAVIWAAVAVVQAIVAALAQIIGIALLGYLLLARR